MCCYGNIVLWEGLGADLVGRKTGWGRTGATIVILSHRRSIERYRLLALTRRGAAILEWCSAPLSVIRLAVAMNCQRT